MKKTLIITAILLLAITSASAQPPQPLSSPITITTDPSKIQPDGISKSKITIFVVFPDIVDFQGIAGQPANDTRLVVTTSLGIIAEYNRESNQGSTITVYTGSIGNSAGAVVLLSSNSSGMATVTVSAPDLGNTTTIIMNSTTVQVGAATPIPTVTWTSVPPPPTSGSPTATVTRATSTITPTKTTNITATATPTPTITQATPTATITQATPTPTATKTPGFEAIVGITGLLAVAYFMLRQRQ